MINTPCTCWCESARGPEMTGRFCSPSAFFEHFPTNGSQILPSDRHHSSQKNDLLIGQENIRLQLLSFSSNRCASSFFDLIGAWTAKTKAAARKDALISLFNTQSAVPLQKTTRSMVYKKHLKIPQMLVSNFS